MNEMLRKWWSRFNSILDRYSRTQKRNIAIAIVAALICAIVILWVLLKPHYVTVMSGLDNKSLGQVEQQLQTLKIPDRIVGSAVEVPASQADTARVQLAMAGLPKSGYIGYSSVSNSFGMTSDQFNIQVLDALQQSLNQTIESIDGIQSAQVHIVMPDQQLFVTPDPSSTAKASVFVQLGAGVQLSAAQVAGIQQLVAHSVKGLNPSEVTVVDQNGATLSSTQSGSAAQAAGATDEITLRQKMEQDLTAKITAGLNQILGPGNSVVMVHANVTFDKVQSQSRIYQAQPGQTTGLPASTSTSKSTSSSNSTSGAGGVPGPSSTNPGTPTYAGVGSNGGSSTSSQSQTTTNYVNSYVDSQTVNDPVQIKGFTVGVFLNSANNSLSPAVVNQIKGFIANAVGMQYGPNTQNNITVSTAPFQKPATMGTQSSSLWIWIGLAALLLLGGGGWLFMRNRKKQPSEVVDVPRSPSDALDKRPVSEEEEMKDELARLADRKPDEFVSLLRTWLSGD